MKYTNKTFTLPASERCSDKNWDLAFVSDEEFFKRYGITKEDYKRMLNPDLWD